MSSPEPLSARGATLALSGVCKSRGGRSILQNFDLVAPPGQCLSILGPSGVGKSTILDLIAGFLEVDAGRIEINGVDVTHLPANKREIGFIFQDFALFPHMSVEENVRFPLDARKVARCEATTRARAALQMVKLAGFESRGPTQLSGGQRQRVAIARALVSQPSLLLMDEPLSSLDQSLREGMMQEIRDLQRQTHVTVVCVTHDLTEALAMSDRIAILGSGRIVQVGTPDEIHHRPISTYVARLAGPVNVVSLRPADADPVGQALRGRVAAFAPDGETEMIGVRPYRLGIRQSPPTNDEVLAVEGVVVDSKLTGSGYTYTVRVGSSAPWQVVSTHAFGNSHIGARVWLEWEKSNTLLMAADSTLDLA